MKSKQLELDVQRRRVKIEGDADVTLRVDKNVAAAVAANPAGAVEHLQTEADKLHAQMEVDDSFVWDCCIDPTDWHDGRKVSPTCSGWWDAKSHSPALPDKVCRLWFDAETRQWRDRRQGGLVYAAPLWRGLKAPWPLGYAYKVRRLRVRIEEGV